VNIKVADQVWIATALLHREQPDSDDFRAKEIRERAMKEFGHKDPKHSVWYHVITHCVAEKKANPGRYRMLRQTERGRRRLLRPGDEVHPDRSTGKDLPRKEEIPERYWKLLDWYRNEYARAHSASKSGQPTAPTGDGKQWLQFVGYISAHDLRLMADAIEKTTEGIDPHEW
jgi:hypothetical protein